MKSKDFIYSGDTYIPRRIVTKTNAKQTHTRTHTQTNGPIHHVKAVVNEDGPVVAKADRESRERSTLHVTRHSTTSRSQHGTDTTTHKASGKPESDVCTRANSEENAGQLVRLMGRHIHISREKPKTIQTVLNPK